MSRLRPKLTYANVMVTILAFIVLGAGGAYGASQLGKNTVGPKQLKKNAVTTSKVKKEAITAAKVRKGTLTGTQINASTLGTVPTAQTANTIVPPEPWHMVGAPGEPQFQNGCKNPPGESVPPVRFFKDHEGLVHLEGVYSSCALMGNIAFQLPAGYRPVRVLQFALAFAGEGKALAVFPSSDQPNAGGVGCGSSSCILNGITFRAES